MRAKEFLEKVKKLDLPMNEFYILGGGALLLYGLRKETADIDLCISMELLESLTSEGKIDINSKDKNGFYKLIEYPDIEVVPNNKEEFMCIRFGDFYLEDIRQILEYKKKRNQKKDKVDVESINYFLNIHPRYPEF